MSPPFRFPDTLPWAEWAGPLAAADDAIARLDERLRASPVKAGWLSRTHFSDATACMWREGELTHTEDLVLHDAGMDARAPTAELIRAHMILRTRRRIAVAHPQWAVSAQALEVWRGRGNALPDTGTLPGTGTLPDAAAPPEPDEFETVDVDTGEPGDSGAFARIDALLARTGQRLRQTTIPAGPRDALVYDPDWEEDARLGRWCELRDQTSHLPPVLAAALIAQAWEAVAPLQRQMWLGPLLVAASLRARGKTGQHLLCLHDGLRQMHHQRRGRHAGAHDVIFWLEAMTMAARNGMQAHDRWLLARQQLERMLPGRRRNSSLPGLIDLVLASPIASAAMIAAHLNVTQRAALLLVKQLGLREFTGRGRYRAWGII